MQAGEFWGAQAGASACLVGSSDLQIAITNEAHLGAGIGTVGVEASENDYIQLSNATNVNQLHGPFTYLYAAFATPRGGLYGSVFFNGTGSVVGADIGVSFGGGDAVGWFESNTSVHVIAGPGGVLGDIAAGAFDTEAGWILPRYLTQSDYGLAIHYVYGDYLKWKRHHGHNPGQPHRQHIGKECTEQPKRPKDAPPPNSKPLPQSGGASSWPWG